MTESGRYDLVTTPVNKDAIVELVKQTVLESDSRKAAL